MAADFTNDEYVDILLIYGECERNARASARLYAERYPERMHPLDKTFTGIVERLRETGSFEARERSGAPKSATDEDHETDVLAFVSINPTSSVREISRETDISFPSVWRILSKHNLHPFKIHLVQELHGNDFVNRMEFCHWVRESLAVDNTIADRIMFTDEAKLVNNKLVIIISKIRCHFEFVV